MARLDGRVALVTGAASGIGQACVARLSDDGATVVGLDVAGDTDVVADVRDEAAVAAAVDRVIADHSRLDIVVNAAGVAGGGLVHTLELAEWERVIGVNLTGTFLVCKHALAVMLDRRSGSIINLASIEGIEGIEGGGPYNASKGGVVTLTKNMAIDYGPAGIRVNCICPGFVDTPMLRPIIEGDHMAGFREHYRREHKLGRFARPDEIAAAAAFLASDDASFVTGHTLVVDGGFTAGPAFGLDLLGLGPA